MSDDDRINALIQAVHQNTAEIKKLKTAILDFIKAHETSYRALAAMRELDQLERDRERLERDNPEAPPSAG
jgi:hypothetical protein